MPSTPSAPLSLGCFCIESWGSQDVSQGSWTEPQEICDSKSVGQEGFSGQWPLLEMGNEDNYEH